jgi:hypothetical protein
MLKNFRFMLESVDPHKFNEVIYEAYIVFLVTTDSGAGPQTSE